MDVLSIIGIVLAFTAVVGGNLLEGGELSALANLPAALLVVGGTVGAGLLQMPLAGLRRALAMMRWVFLPPRHGFAEGIGKFFAGRKPFIRSFAKTPIDHRRDRRRYCGGERSQCGRLFGRVGNEDTLR